MGSFCFQMAISNYEFCSDWILDRKTENRIRVLDYGCGSGEVVKNLLNHDVNAFGCDVFYEGGDHSKEIDFSVLGNAIKIMEKGECIIPFDDASFDIVINNQVMEHVVDLNKVLSEINRVLVPGGTVLSLFPAIDVWREGHCGIPFLHWFPKGSRSRVYYAAVCRILGFGKNKGSKTIMDWSRDSCNWLDSWTYYRTQKEIEATYARFFYDINHIEDFWLQQRLGVQKSFAAWLPPSFQKFFVRKLGGIVFVAHKIG